METGIIKDSVAYNSFNNRKERSKEHCRGKFPRIPLTLVPEGLCRRWSLI
jgi:hypothetical protein